MESDIFHATKLLDLLKKFSDYNSTNDIIKAYPIKIRQQIYGFLGSLGFENNGMKQEHLFIKIIKTKLNKSINNLRTINHKRKK